LRDNGNDEKHGGIEEWRWGRRGGLSIFSNTIRYTIIYPWTGILEGIA